ncbi:hypothetical protein Zmor_013178 [Zophobas morio]|uniref:Luciferin 4-monooxygenase n=1 Tax=Zophobas morio TaxID=2755281 RepID=A0AA38IF49_9CUCU|nr:hypothetical protein Zmor_013178 [Zophobas morio]
MSARILQGPKQKNLIEEKTLGRFIFNRCTKYYNNLCQIDGTTDKCETYGSLKLRGTRLAIELQKRGVTSKDVIVVCSENTLDAVIPIVAGTFIGAKVSNLDPSLSTRHIKHLLSLVEPRVIFVQESSIKLIEECILNNDFQTEIIVFGTSQRYSLFSDLIKEQENEDEFEPVDVDPEDTALMFFSSGTTGLPKAICHSSRGYMEMVTQTCQIGWIDKVLHFTTFYWMTAMMIFLGCCNFGNYRVFCRNASGEDIFKIIQKYKVKSMFMAPTLTYKLTRVENPRKYDTSSLKTITVGGTPISAVQIEKLSQMFPTAITYQLYGMTEIGLISGFGPDVDQETLNRKITSCGKLSSNTKLKVVDFATGEMLPPNKKGEICVFSRSLMKGYHKKDSSQTFEKDGFLKTGDEGYYDEEEYIYIVERIKEMFKYQSWHIIPSSIETVLLEHPAVKEAVVFGLPHDEDGEVPAACLVLKQGGTIGEQEIDKFLTERVADRERLRGGVTFVETLPQTPTGKIDRPQVRDFVVNMKN